jgi:GTP-binding protein Era
VTDEFRSGFVTVVGRPNVGKSTLVNAILGTKVAIVSDKPQTTRNQIRGVLNRSDVQVVFIDTPGIHKPKTLLGKRLNDRAAETFGEVDVICLVIDATAPIGAGDRFVAKATGRVTTPRLLVVNKTDAAKPDRIAAQLAAATEELGDFDAFVPLSARTGDGVDRFVGEVIARMPEGPQYYPADVVTDQPETFLAAELVREKLLAVARQELPHSIAVSVEDVEERPSGTLAIRAVVRVERESQKAIVIGHRGEVLKRAGTEARLELEALLGAPVFLETVVKVEKDWQQRAHALDRLGF